MHCNRFAMYMCFPGSFQRYVLLVLIARTVINQLFLNRQWYVHSLRKGFLLNLYFIHLEKGNMFGEVMSLCPWPLPTASAKGPKAVKDLALCCLLLKGVSPQMLGSGYANKLNLSISNVDNIGSTHLLLSAWNIYILIHTFTTAPIGMTVKCQAEPRSKTGQST